MALRSFGKCSKGDEDGRYALLREKFGARINLFHLFFFQAQALSVVYLSLPFVLAARDGSPAPAALDLAGAGVWVIGLVGEVIADAQLKAFKGRAGSKGRTCREGLWRYSRHPNYFFEWLMWCGYGLVALGGSMGWVGLLAPATIFVLVRWVTGIPPTERRALQSRGDDYREYQRTTSALVPWFPGDGRRPQ